MSFLMRAADFKDIPQLETLARHFTLENLSADKNFLEDKIKLSQASFQKKVSKEDRNFLFVLEDSRQKKIVGSSQILSAFKADNHPYFLKVEEKGKQYLKLTRDSEGKHQMGGLILHPDYRGTKERLGLLLGGVRFLYLKAFLKEFSKNLEVNLTAPFDQDGGHSFFWEEVGRKCLDKSLLEALELYRTEKLAFFSSFPKNLKIPLESLSEKAKLSLKTVHSETQPAYKALIRMGFYKINKHHLIDGGLYLEAETQKIPLVSEACLVSFKKKDNQKESLYLVGQKTKKGFVGAFLKGVLDGDFFYIKNLPSFFREDEKAYVKNCPAKNPPDLKKD